ncbi:MAG TPA: hypothetical protein VJR91_02705 [Burkholderia sp.]|nr:hypothetical protein [Burkholderia sp.]
MKAPINETLVMDIAGQVAVVVTNMTAVTDVPTQYVIERHGNATPTLLREDQS